MTGSEIIGLIGGLILAGLMAYAAIRMSKDPFIHKKTR